MTLTSDEWVEIYRARLADELAGMAGVRPGTTRGDLVLGAAVQLAEEIIGQVMRHMEDRDSSLRRELRLAKVSSKVIESQLMASQQALLEFQKTRRRSLIQTCLVGLGTLGLALAGGASEGIASTMATDAPPASTTVVDFRDLAAACGALSQLVEEAGSDSSTGEPGDAGSGGGSDPEEPEIDHPSRGEDPWLEFEDNEGTIRLKQDFHPSEASDWRTELFDPQEAAEWKSEGFDPYQAAEWKAGGFEPGEAVEWVTARVGVQQAADFRSKGFEARSAADWLLRGFQVDAALEWAEAGFDPYSAEEWSSYGFSVMEAERAASRGKEPFEAVLEPGG
jgi:hypothetical protein